MKVKVAQSCLTLCNPMDCSLPCFSVHGILQAKVLKVGSHSLLQDIVSTQGSNPSLPHCRWILYRLSHQGSPAVQGILKSLLKHHNLKASVLPCSAFFMIQFSHPYMTTGKTIALIIWTFVGKVMSLHFNVLPRFVRAFLSRSKCHLISWVQSPSAVILEPPK